MTDGVYELDVKGQLNIHGVTNDIETKSTLTVKGGKLSGELKFFVAVKDYKIKIPNVVVKNIAEQVEVTANFEYEPYK